MEIRGFTVKYSKRNAKAFRDREIALQEKINALQAQAEKHPHNRSIIIELQAEKSRLKRIMTHKTKAAILRSKVRWHEQGERNTNYFYGLEKRNYNNKTVTRLKIGENIKYFRQFLIFSSRILPLLLARNQQRNDRQLQLCLSIWNALYNSKKGSHLTHSKKKQGQNVFREPKAGISVKRGLQNTH